ncbi:TPA: hypothetical protein L3V69_001423 [Vibrio parahaemolyticus]|nr:hypothetical protein [Vibrio parahaemolyticus]HBN6316408.1 hypothetical protein [Vibrio parahaemolyticus]HCD5128855.1 hypothetical protein [Vibrio parahaemolyticus]HCD5207928.1 hypothetical protein [Vibrio parahaemolyticus]
MTEQLNEMVETKDLDLEEQLNALLKQKEKAEEEQRKRDEQIAELQLSMKEEALDEFEKTYRKLNIKPQDLAKRFGFEIAKEKVELEPEKTKSKRKTQEHISFLYIKDGVHYQRKSSSPRTFLVEPWKSLLFNGNINDHCTLYYADIPEEKVRVSGKYDEAVKTLKVTRKYFTKAMINNGEKLPEKNTDMERTDNKVIQDVEALKTSVRSMLESSK